MYFHAPSLKTGVSCVKRGPRFGVVRIGLESPLPSMARTEPLIA